MDLELKGKKTLITGCLGGFGRAMVEAFQAEGAIVTGTGRKPREAVGEELQEAFSGSLNYRPLDYAAPDGIRELIEEVRPDIVIANAGQTSPQPLHETTAGEWERVLSVNLTGNFQLGQAAANHMAGAGGGTILFVGSWAQTVPQENLGAYGPSKAGMKMMALCLAKEMAPKGVRINVISPGIIDTGMAARQMAGQPERRERATRVSLCGRLGRAEEIADACLFLCSERAAFIHGADLLIDGGASLA
jgi:NAD(P)-dependent dehydrogenase (short-subunit alcohol dehydrogenase family)